jgi:uncharacterized protein (TIGR02444 family)
MTETETKAQTPFWRFSLRFYRQAGVSDACIALQDGCGVDVNLLLFLFWLADSGRLLTSDEVKNLDDSVRDWRNLTIIPIRDTRRKLKGARTLVDPGLQEVFRDRVKAVELEAERLQQEGLYAFTQSGPLGRPAAPGDAARANISAYARLMGTSFPAGAVAILVSAFDSIEHGRHGAPKAASGRA